MIVSVETVEILLLPPYFKIQSLGSLFTLSSASNTN